MSLRFLTAGESHGKGLIAILDGLPAGIPVDPNFIKNELDHRRESVGRSHRMSVEKDDVEILSGVRHGKTIGSPISLSIRNRDYQLEKPLPILTAPRPGHADLAGTLKFKHRDIRLTWERSSARETAIRVGVGALCQLFLKEFNVFCFCRVIQIGNVTGKNTPFSSYPTVEDEMVLAIELAQEEGETLGGIFEIAVQGLPVGLGNYNQWDQRLDGRLAKALMSLPAIKGVEVGEGFKSASMRGSQYQDEIFFNSTRKKSFGFYRKTNRSGGLEGGITTGEDLILRAAMKPLSTLTQHPLKTVDLLTKEPTIAFSQRTDTCAAPAAALIAKNVVAIELSKALLQKFGGDSIRETQKNLENYLSTIDT